MNYPKPPETVQEYTDYIIKYKSLYFKTINEINTNKQYSEPMSKFISDFESICTIWATYMVEHIKQ